MSKPEPRAFVTSMSVGLMLPSGRDVVVSFEPAAAGELRAVRIEEGDELTPRDVVELGRVLRLDPPGRWQTDWSDMVAAPDAGEPARPGRLRTAIQRLARAEAAWANTPSDSSAEDEAEDERIDAIAGVLAAIDCDEPGAGQATHAQAMDIAAGELERALFALDVAQDTGDSGAVADAVAEVHRCRGVLRLILPDVADPDPTVPPAPASSFNQE